MHHELVKSEALATSLSNSGAGSLSETKSSNGELWNLEDSLIISDSADDDGDSVSNNSALVANKLTAFGRYV